MFSFLQINESKMEVKNNTIMIMYGINNTSLFSFCFI